MPDQVKKQCAHKLGWLVYERISHQIHKVETGEILIYHRPNTMYCPICLDIKPAPTAK